MAAAVSITAAAARIELDIPPISTSVDAAGRSIPVIVSGSISESSVHAGDPAVRIFDFHLRAGLGGFADNITSVVEAELNRSERCGNRISIQNAILAPAPPSARLTIQLHAEKWACLKAFGHENTKRIVNGDATVEVSITPVVDPAGTLRLDADVGRVDANGSLGELVHNNVLGPEMRDRIRDSIARALERVSNPEATMPSAARPFALLGSAAFNQSEDGRLGLILNGQIKIPAAEVSGILGHIHP